MQDSMIRVKNLTVAYGNRTILDKVTLDVYEGEILAILGESGCGKSTLMRHMIGLQRPTRGEVLIEGRPLLSSDGVINSEILRKIGVLFQGGALFGSMTLLENVALPIRFYTNLPDEAVNALARLKLRMVKLNGYEDYYPNQISGGMKKRAALARAMALNPRILFFDEPSAGLDPISTAELDELIMNVNRKFGTTIIMVTHDLQTVLTVASRVILLDKRRKGILAEGSPRFLKEHSRNSVVRRFFDSFTCAGERTVEVAA